MAKSKITRVQDRKRIGVYIWVLPNGEPLSNDNGDVLNIVSERGDMVQVNNLRYVAAQLGYPEGYAVWEPRRRIDDEELEHQRDRFVAGLVPDPLDPEAIAEEREFLQHDQRYGR